MNVLSLCNGCGMIRPALERAGLEVTRFYSSEIDLYANIVNNANYPDTIQLGDLRDWKTWDLPKIDYSELNKADQTAFLEKLKSANLIRLSNPSDELHSKHTRIDCINGSILIPTDNVITHFYNNVL